MRKVRNRLLVAVIAVAVLATVTLSVSSEARTLGSRGSSFLALKPGPGTCSGEPDSGDNRTVPPKTNSHDPGTGTPAPNGYRWIIATWAARYLGVGW